MYRKRGWFILLAALIACGTAPRAIAGTIFVKYVQPQDVDPPTSIFFAFDGFPFRLTGEQMLDGDLGGGGGYEFHAAVSKEALQFREIVLETEFLAPLEVNSGVAPAFDSFTPWAVESFLRRGKRVIILRMGDGSAPIQFIPTTESVNYFASLIARAEERADADAFRSATFLGRAFFHPGHRTVVPEPGALALLGSLLVAGSYPLLRRLRRR